MTEKKVMTGEDRLRSALTRTSQGVGAVACKAALALALLEGAEVSPAVRGVIRSMGEDEQEPS